MSICKNLCTTCLLEETIAMKIESKLKRAKRNLATAEHRVSDWVRKTKLAATKLRKWRRVHKRLITKVAALRLIGEGGAK